MSKTDISEQVDTETGVVRWYDSNLGYGFIVPDDGKGDVFVHHSDIAVDGFRQLGRGNRVEYEEVATDNGGRKALRVEILSTLDD